MLVLLFPRPFPPVINTQTRRAKEKLKHELFVAELPDRTSAALLLPLSKDSKTKEENHKLLNGNSGDPADWVWRFTRFYFPVRYL